MKTFNLQVTRVLRNDRITPYKCLHRAGIPYTIRRRLVCSQSGLEFFSTLFLYQIQREGGGEQCSQRNIPGKICINAVDCIRDYIRDRILVPRRLAEFTYTKNPCNISHQSSTNVFYLSQSSRGFPQFCDSIRRLHVRQVTSKFSQSFFYHLSVKLIFKDSPKSVDKLTRKRPISNLRRLNGVCECRYRRVSITVEGNKKH